MSTQAIQDTTHSVVNTADLDTPVERVWRAATEIERWPEIFPWVLASHRIPLGGDDIIMEMTVDNELGQNTVRSRRHYTPAGFRIDFEMWTLPATIATMTGHWRIEPLPEGARLVMVHDFVPRPDGPLDADELGAALFRTNEHVLDALKSWLGSHPDELVGPADQGDVEGGVEGGVEGDVEDTSGPRTAANGISPATFQRYEVFFSRLGLAGLGWGDITNVLTHLGETASGDWADWHRRWSDLGLHYERWFGAEVAAGHLETARTCVRKAAACHHFAEFFHLDDLAAKDASRRRVTEVFDSGIPFLRERVTPLAIPYPGDGAGDTLPGYLIAPPAGDGPWPTVVLVNGLDSAKEVELFAFARELTARDMAAVVFDGPGQGVLAGHLPLVPNFEDVVAAVLATARDLSEVDADRMGIFGVSFGGYLAARAAAQLGGFKACVNLSGGFDYDNYRQINPLVRSVFRYVFGEPDDDAMARLCERSVNLRDTPPLTIPLLAIHGELDTITPIESCDRMLAWATGETRLIRYPGERHVATNYFGDFIPRFSDWLADRLKARS
ncbi:MAG TPA: SRPBCC family protein [Pseudonocardiaceae bacterium]